MKKLALLIVPLLFVSVLSANDALKITGDSLYTVGDYVGAVSTYENIVQSGLESDNLYYNLGNAYYKTGDLPNAILHYEKALKLKPGHNDAAYNLELAQQYITDKIEVVDVFFLKKWITGLRQSFTSDEWAYLSAGAFFVFILLLLLFTFSGRAALKRISFYVGVLFLIASIVGMWGASKSKSDYVDNVKAIIFSPSVTIKGSPNSKGTDLFILHEGAKVSVIDSVGTWKRIKLQDGNVGWLQGTALKDI